MPADQNLPGYVCPRDGTRVPAGQLRWRCPVCGSPWDLDFTAGALDRAALVERPPSLWRYAEALPVSAPVVGLGEGRTPLIPLDGRVSAKLDYLMPTLSFKDRGAALLVEAARRIAPRRIVADSSGNAGTAIAAYAARAGLPCRISVPAETSEQKLEQIHGHGAAVDVVAGDRSAAARSARAAADEPGTFYASHVFNPYFPHGTKTYAYELWEDLGGRLPDVLLVPVGNGTLLLGVALAVEELSRNGLIARRPRIVGVQASAVAPLAAAHRAGRTVPAGAETTDTDRTASTIAEGIAIAEPARAPQILTAIDRTAGDILTVEEAQISAAQTDLARRGLYVETTAAVCWAAVRAAEQTDPGQRRPSERLLADAETVIPLCGAGLKTGLAPV